MRLAAIYGAGAAMGFTPQQINDMTVWQYMAAVDGYVKANSSEGGDKLGADEIDELWEWVKEG